MREFFRGWKRKVGCVTLVLACGFMTLWLRSRGVIDVANLGTHARYVQTLISEHGRLIWFTTPDPDQTNVVDEFFVSEKASKNGLISDLDLQWDHRQCWLGFEFGRGKMKTTDWGGTVGGESSFDEVASPAEQMLPSENPLMTIVALPYWSIIAPLTLVSLWLLLSKPRESTSKKITQLMPESVV